MAQPHFGSGTILVILTLGVAHRTKSRRPTQFFKSAHQLKHILFELCPSPPISIFHQLCNRQLKSSS